MAHCVSCLRTIPDDSRLCAYCGTPVEAPATIKVDAKPQAGTAVQPPVSPSGPTVVSPARPPASPKPTKTDSSSSDSIDEARFTAGTMLTQRYRIVGLLGKGGMGEVYRAEDLTLRQSVALKFLPEALSKDPRRLERFLHEVRVARQVSHPNVCRVYDISEVDGHHFISMEYVDGEDLATLFRRLGRPAKEKSLQIARQLCAGLAAAHDKGVLHRDLKPHNVMIDGQGRVRITDFGLAGFAEEFIGREVLAGTPAYMAPEQLAGRGVSVKSDIYSLGLVLCELFTGKRVFEGATREQVERSRSSVPTTLSTLVDDLDPAVERVILRCLAQDPTARPSSALAVAAALPGGDPLAAALEAGETPSPEMVAAAGEAGGMHPAAAVACFALIILGTLAMSALAKPVFALRRIPLPKTPEALADRAADIISRLGYSGPVADTAHGFGFSAAYSNYIREHDKTTSCWDRIAAHRPSPVFFWYRQSPRPLIPNPAQGRVGENDPPLWGSGMISVRLDPQGRLVALQADPPERDSDPPASGPATSTPWAPLFAEAQIDPSGFNPTAPQWTPDIYCDERAAWQGHFTDQPEVPIRIEAGAYRGKPAFFRIIEPWTKPLRMEAAVRPWGEAFNDALNLSTLALLVVGGVFLAYRNLRLRRSDRAGANRFAITFFCLLSAGSMLAIDHVTGFFEEFLRIRDRIGLALLAASVAWLWYIALEPYVRRRWPQVLISWSRLISGRLRDPLIGRDILVGGIATVALGLLAVVQYRSPGWLGQPPPPPEFAYGRLLVGFRQQIGAQLEMFFVFFALLILFFFLALRLLLRRDWLAVCVVLTVSTFLSCVNPINPNPKVLFIGILADYCWWLLTLTVLLRFGLLALIAYFCFWFPSGVVMGLGLSGWQSGPSWTAMLLIATAAANGCYTAMAGRPLLKDELLDA